MRELILDVISYKFEKKLPKAIVPYVFSGRQLAIKIEVFSRPPIACPTHAHRPPSPAPFRGVDSFSTESNQLSHRRSKERSVAKCQGVIKPWI